jgi:tetratricopeptide (TPR) repeat protein
LPFEETDKDYYLRLEVTGELKDRLGVRADGFEGRIQVRFTPEEVEVNRFFPLLYQQRLLLFPGDYSLDLTVRTPATRAVGHQSLKVSVPPSPTDKMQLSSLLLTYGAEEPESALQQLPFLRDTKLILPRVDRSFRYGSTVYVYYELYQPERHDAGSTLSADYLVMRGEEVVNRETLRLPEGTGEPALPVLHPLPLEGLELGTYTLVVQVTDADRGETVVGEEDFVISEKFQVRGRINAVLTDNLAPAQTETRLGRYWLGRGELGKARDHFEKAYRNQPQSTEARVNLARVLALQGEIKIARDLLSAALAQDAQNVDALLAMAYVHFRLGDHDQAIKDYEHALSVEQTDLAWNGLAELYLSLAETEKALHCLKRSLELNANQPDVASKIRDLEKTRDENQM